MVSAIDAWRIIISGQIWTRNLTIAICYQIPSSKKNTKNPILEIFKIYQFLIFQTKMYVPTVPNTERSSLSVSMHVKSRNVKEENVELMPTLIEIDNFFWLTLTFNLHKNTEAAKGFKGSWPIVTQKLIPQRIPFIPNQIFYFWEDHLKPSW